DRGTNDHEKTSHQGVDLADQAKAAPLLGGSANFHAGNDETIRNLIFGEGGQLG
ncbi:unnamed protein product, partial [Amoebophrya sp. A25]